MQSVVVVGVAIDIAKILQQKKDISIRHEKHNFESNLNSERPSVWDSGHVRWQL